jgi:glycosyltransferase involved in cell wall biosynthesis
MKNYLVICPVYNEERTLKKFYHKLRRYYAQDVLFVDDGSTDKGRDFLQHCKDKRTFVVRHPQRRGYGMSLLSGFAFSMEQGYKKILTIDVDLQHDPLHIQSFFRRLENYEVALGSRYIRVDWCLEIPRERMVINRYVASLLTMLFRVEFTDPFCGYRGYRDSFLRNIFLREKSYGISLEILLEIVRTKSSFSEIPIKAIYFECRRTFLDGLDDPRGRLLHYLEVIACKKKEIENEEEIFSCQPTS